MSKILLRANVVFELLLFLAIYFLGNAKDCAHRFGDVAEAFIKFPGTPEPEQEIFQVFVKAVHGLDSCFDEGNIQCLKDAVNYFAVSGGEAAISHADGKLKEVFQTLLPLNKKINEELADLPSSNDIVSADQLMCELFNRNSDILTQYMKQK